MAAYEYIVVGSGCTAAMAAQTLVESGANVLMIDAGVTDKKYARLIPDKDYLSIRKTEKDQYRYLVGDSLEGITWGSVGKGEQITPPRKYILAKTDEILPTKSENFSVVESLAYGGLGSGWGIGTWMWSDKELEKAGLNPEEMAPAYQTVLDRIGISATNDDAQEYTIRSLKNYDKSASADAIHSRIYKKYKKKREYLKKLGFVMGRAPLALITKDRGSRKKYDYSEMEYYSDKKQSAYRPWITINQLKKKTNFTYVSGQLVTKFEENKSGVIITTQDIDNQKKNTFSAKKLVLAAGIFGTARIVLRSQPSKDSSRLPLLCNPYSYVPCIHPASLGRPAEKKKLGFANLSFFLDEASDNSKASMASLYGYQSLMLFRMARQVPLNFKDARVFLQYLLSGLLIMGIHHPDSPSPDKYVSLEKDSSSPTNDSLKVHYKLSKEEIAENKRREKKYMRAMRSLGAFPLKKFAPGNGASIHYAGTLPFSSTPSVHTLDTKGKLHGTKNVYVADGSGFTYLPAKGLTFSLMANAHRTAMEVLND
ncbi:MAG TPA: GMC oxidoreductase [Candidatus Saccharimonadales bacterium]